MTIVLSLANNSAAHNSSIGNVTTLTGANFVFAISRLDDEVPLSDRLTKNKIAEQALSDESENPCNSQLELVSSVLIHRGILMRSRV